MKRPIIILLAVVVLAVVVGGTYAALGHGGIGGDDSDGAAAEDVPKPPPIPTFTAIPSSTPVPAGTLLPEPTATPQPPPTSEGKESVTPAPLGCPDCAVKSHDQLPVEVKDIQLGADGKYFVPDRGDGCRYEEAYRTPSRSQQSKGLEEVILRAPNCEVTWTFVPATGELAAVVP